MSSDSNEQPSPASLWAKDPISHYPPSDRRHRPPSEEDVKQKQLPATASRRSLFVRSLPTSASDNSLLHFFSQSYAVKHATVVSDPITKQNKGYGFVTFADADDASTALQTLDGALFDGKKIIIEYAEPRLRHSPGHRQNLQPNQVTPYTSISAVHSSSRRHKGSSQHPLKLIVRNLPWTIAEPEQLAALFRSYGKVKHATIPKKAGLSTGFGFVALRGRRNSEKALQEMNGKNVNGRTLAVDWAVQKEVWYALRRENEQTGMPDKPMQEDGPASDAEIVKPGDTRTADAAIVSDDSSSSNPLYRRSESSLSRSFSMVSQDSNQEDILPSTVFVRNIPFTTTDETLRDHFSFFGPVRYARIVQDPATGRPKGTGFVSFRNSETVKVCIKESPKQYQLSSTSTNRVLNVTTNHFPKNSVVNDVATDQLGHYTIEGRVLQVSRAVNKVEAARLATALQSSSSTCHRDKRRLYLLSEGVVPSDSALYQQLSPSEIKLREASARQRQSLVKNNPSLHLSLTRLSIRNLPRSITSKALKALAREAVVGFSCDVKAGRRQRLSKEELTRSSDSMREAERSRKAKRKGIVKQAKIVFEGRDGTKVAEVTGAGRSRGYGFIEYTSHRWALMGLRWLNGHAVRSLPKEGTTGSKPRQEAGTTRRLIVEFAIENAQVVGRRHEREIKTRIPLNTDSSRVSEIKKHPTVAQISPVRSRDAEKSKVKRKMFSQESQASGAESTVIPAKKRKIVTTDSWVQKARDG